MLRPPPERRPVRLSKRTGRRLWIAAALDMVAIAWMIAVGSWLDHTSKITAVITLGGHHVLVMIIALAGFLMLASGAVLTNGFRYANRLQLTLITAGLRDLHRRVSRSALRSASVDRCGVAPRLPGSNVSWTLTALSPSAQASVLTRHEAEHRYRSKRQAALGSVVHRAYGRVRHIASKPTRFDGVVGIPPQHLSA